MASLSEPSNSPSDTLRYGELLVDCTFPELLASDLERSRDIFLSKDMTAGCPYAGLAAPEAKGVLRMTGCLEKEPWMRVDETRHNHRNGESDSDSKRGSPNSSPSQKLVKDPVSIRAGQLSVITEATVHGTWFEDDPESPQEEPESSVFTARTSVSDRPEAVSELARNMSSSSSSMRIMDISEESSTNEAPASKCMAVHVPRSKYCSVPTPVPREKPRIIDIPPPAVGESKALPASLGRVAPDLASAKVGNRETTSAPAAGVGMIRLRRQLSTECSLSGGTGMGPSLLDEGSDNGEESVESLALENFLPAVRKPPLARRPLGVDTRPATPALTHSSLSRYPTSSPLPSLPLPPDVIESLRVSISCFPETMLLTSSLSIETIRAYSKKVRRRTPIDGQFQNVDSDAGSVSSSSSQQQSRRWNMGGWLGHARRGSNMSTDKEQQARQRPSAIRLTRSLSNAKISRLLRSTGADLVASTTRPPWAPIANVFPSAPARLCDALYAHLLAYNYLPCSWAWTWAWTVLCRHTNNATSSSNGNSSSIIIVIIIKAAGSYSYATS
ncbi:hypothetical protein VTJ49DRAFT_2382 [Mycothermus thermophilus]|uniref:Uncharacterized protein n=1 Tax=Humicola insolens TaxID=85995 RepID=A0ABR3VQ24_HUMIN